VVVCLPAAGGLAHLALAERDATRRDVWRSRRRRRGSGIDARLLVRLEGRRSLADSGHLAADPAGAAWETYGGRVAGTLLLPAAAGLLAQGVPGA
jgi:hypothetical protein